jgi:hypothetical protein
MAFQFRRGTDAERQSITPKPGEPLYVTDTGQVYVGDGTTQGGNLVSISVSDDDSPSLGGNLDLNGNNIIGSGNINIDGTITATGNINLGDGAEDNIIVGGQIESNLIPGYDGIYNLGSESNRWRNGFFEGLTVDGVARIESLEIGTIYGEDSSILYDTITDTITVETVESNLIGSVFLSDSTLAIDKDTGAATISTLELLDNEIILNDSLQVNNGIELNDPSILGLAINGQCFENDTNNGIDLKAFSGSISNPETVGDDFLLSAFITKGFHTDRYTGSSLITFTVDGTIDPGIVSVPGKINFFTSDGTTDNVNASREMSYNSKGVLTAPVFKATAYTDTDFPSNPEEGWFIFDTTNKQFVGYNGTDWVTLG